jgi:uncharacterized protein involved in response to NO
MVVREHPEAQMTVPSTAGTASRPRRRADPAARSAPPAWLSFGFRPFFLAAAAWSAVALGVWAAMLARGFVLPSRLQGLSWHAHEMLFGFVMAAVGGFLLTAIPNWTGRRPVQGAMLAVLAALWAVGRIACLVSALMPAWAAVAADLAFTVAIGAVVAYEIVGGRHWRNLPMLAPVAVLGAANLLMHLESLGVRVPAGLGWRLGLAAVMVLLSVIGGRITPAFTRNWLVKRGEASADDFPPGGVDRLALGALLAGLFTWAAAPAAPAAGWLLIAGAAANLWRLSRWRGADTLQEPLLTVLHLGYAWLVAGAALLGWSVLSPAVPLGAAVHALTVGAVGTMILAVMTRASRGHTGRPLTACGFTRAIYALIVLATLARIAAAFAADWTMGLLLASSVLWIGAFVLFLATYGRMLLTSRPRG